MASGLGIQEGAPTGTTWGQLTGGWNVSVLSEYNDQMWGVNGAGHLYYREGVTTAVPTGKKGYGSSSKTA